MNGRDLLCAFADIDEGMLTESGRFSAIEASVEADRRMTRRRFAAVGVAAAVSLAVLGVMKYSHDPLPLFAPSGDVTTQAPEGSVPPGTTADAVITEPGTTVDVASVTDPVSETGSQPATTGQNTPTAPSTVPGLTETQTPATVAPTAEATTAEATTEDSQNSPPPSTTLIEPALPPAIPTVTDPHEDTTTVAPTRAGIPEKPYPVYVDETVGYQTAREKFGHPIRECTRDDFRNYMLVTVYPDGNVGSDDWYCLIVSYVFENGSIDVKDQDRQSEGVTPTGTAREYQGRTFYVHLPEFNGDRTRVEYFPTGKSGICYQAFYNGKYDVTEIMDAIISIEM